MIEIREMVKPYVVNDIIYLTEAAYILRFSRNSMKFTAGQHLVAGLMNTKNLREYSIYSGTQDDYLEILVREVENGIVSKKLKNLSKGDIIEINGPYGFFMHNINPPKSHKYLFIASGTGIAPFHSFARSYPDADFKIIHGIRNCNEAYQKEHYPAGKYISCTSRDSNGEYHGRVTGYLKETEIDTETKIYLCGNSQMIFESIDILERKGIKRSQIFTEVYF